MSGIIGLVHLDGSPVDCNLLRKLTDYLRFRGPDRREEWVHHNVGFGHTLLRTTEESEYERQPVSVDGESWIVSDARIDGRDDLRLTLKCSGDAEITQSTPDSELILRAYGKWGVNCVQHLLGDFAFAIWDSSKQQLFCARDHLGVKPFYYARSDHRLVFSNTLDCIRKVPFVSKRLNDAAIADFLLFGINQDNATTSFSDIQRIPPAHCAIWSGRGSGRWRYWNMPVDEPIFYSRPEDYSAHFHDLLRKSVGDRLRGSRVQVFMSGGIDSPTLAATARELLTERHASFDLGAVTQIDGFVPDEQKYAGSIATHLGMHIKYRCWTDRQKFDWEQTRVLVPEPDSGACFLSRERRFWRSISADSRVFFNGEGPDNALMLDWKPYIAYLARERRYGQMIRSVLASLPSDRYPPFSRRILGKLRTAVCGSKIPERCYPGWLNPDLESRLHLRERWNSLSTKSPSSHPVRPNAYASFGIPLWQALFERVDSGFTRAALEVRFPFVDIRVLRFLLALPPLPWCRSKYLLRMAMRGRLPKSVLRRGKMTPNARHFREYLAKFCQSRFVPAQQTCEYIDHHRFDHSATCDMVEANLRARSLNHWLYNLYGNSDHAELS